MIHNLTQTTKCKYYLKDETNAQSMQKDDFKSCRKEGGGGVNASYDSC